MKLYQIVHEYGVDGGFGDAVPCDEVIAITADKEKAEEYVKKYSKPIIYDIPYAELVAHILKVKEIEVKELDLDVSPFEGDSFFEEREWLKERIADSPELFKDTLGGKTLEELEEEYR